MPKDGSSIEHKYKILWLTPPIGYSDAMKGVLNAGFRRVQLDPTRIFQVNLQTKSIKEPILVVKGKKKLVFNEKVKDQAKAALDEAIRVIKPNLIVVNSLAALWFITRNERYTLNLCRGSLYVYNDLPCLVLDDLKNIHGLRHGEWVFINDLQKIARWARGNQRPEPKFVYSVCRTVSEVREAVAWLVQSPAIATDRETRSGFITCSCYTGVVDGSLRTYVIPFFNPCKQSGCHWDTAAEECEVWELLRGLHDCEAVKILQNGSYDSAYDIRYNIPLRNYYIDTAHLFHSIWTEAPKKINFIASLCLDYCRYWKDETKGEKEDNIGDNQAALERYWRYNALDGYNTFLCARFLVLLITQDKLSWALKNYVQEFELQVGPCLFATMHGLKIDRRRQQHINKTLEEEYAQNLKNLRMMVDDEDFNPNSHDQVRQLVYDVLRAKPLQVRGRSASNTKDEKSTDKNVLRLLAEDPENLPILEPIVEAIVDVKEPLNNKSKYGEMFLYNERLTYSMNAAGTVTGRLSSSHGPYWCGTNAQNVPFNMREMIVADEGFVLLERDYSQSDARYIAYEAEDIKYIANVESGKDVHLIHCEHFFKKPYAWLLEHKKSKDPFVVRPVYGIREITKRTTHGCGFQMAAPTLYVQQLKRKATIAAATAMGAKNAAKWSTKQLIEFIDKFLMEPFHGMYKRLRPWFVESKDDCIKNGNKATCAFGRTRLFFGDLEGDKKLQRELSAYFGQGGTAGNINRVMRWFYYSETGRALQRQRIYLVLQVHDSLMFQVPKELLHEADAYIKKAMEEYFEIRGRRLRIPSDSKCGFSWGKGCMDYSPDLTLEDLENHENKLQAKYRSKPKELITTEISA